MQLNQILSVRFCAMSMFVILATALTQVNLNAQTPQAQQPTASQSQAKKAKEAKPYLLSSRIHLQKDSNKGYLVVKVELPQGSHIYSLTQKGNLRPTQIAVSASKQFRILGQFAPDKAAEIIKQDPVFKQQVEKHKGTVQFFVPIEVASGVSLQTLKSEVTFDGQVCTQESFCMPILGDKINGKFAGYFERTAKKTTERTASSLNQSKSSSAGSRYR